MVDENKPVVDAIQKSEANEERRHQESQESEKKTEGALKEVTKSIKVFNKAEKKNQEKLYIYSTNQVPDYISTT